MATNVTEVIENARFGRYQILILVMCGIMIFFDGYDLLSISFTAPEFIKLLGIDRSMIGPVFSAGLFGLTIGALTFGMGDKLTKGAAANKTLAAGGFALMPANMNHFAYAAAQETTIVLYGQGPVEFKYVNPADDPRNAKKSPQ